MFNAKKILFFQISDLFNDNNYNILKSNETFQKINTMKHLLISYLRPNLKILKKINNFTKDPFLSI